MNKEKIMELPIDQLFERIYEEFGVNVKDESDMNTAWQVVEKMRERSIAMTISTLGPREEYYIYWTYEGKTFELGKWWSKTAPIAIYRTALLAIKDKTT